MVPRLYIMWMVIIMTMSVRSSNAFTLSMLNRNINRFTNTNSVQIPATELWNWKDGYGHGYGHGYISKHGCGYMLQSSMRNRRIKCVASSSARSPSSYTWLRSSLASSLASPSISSRRKGRRAGKQNPQPSLIQTKMTPFSTPASSTSSAPPLPAPTLPVTMHDYARQDARTMESEILRLIVAGRTHDALSLYQSIWTHDDAITNQQTASRGHSKRHQQQPCCKPTTRLMNHAIHACAKCPSGPMLDRAFHILHFAMEGGARGVRRLSPNVYTFGALVKVCASKGDADRCVALIEQMRVSLSLYFPPLYYSTNIVTLLHLHRTHHHRTSSKCYRTQSFIPQQYRPANDHIHPDRIWPCDYFSSASIPFRQITIPTPTPTCAP